MKMNKFMTMALAVATMVGFASCNKNDDNGRNAKGTQSLSIFIGQPETRAVTTPEAGQTAPVEFKNGELFLVDGSGSIVDIYTFSSAVTNLTTKVLNITDVVTAPGITITGVPGSVTAAYIVGNSSSFKTVSGVAYTAAAVTGQNISGVKGLTILPQMQFNAARDLEDATLWGEGAVIQDPLDTDVTKKYVKIQLRPHTSRIEIADIKAKATTDGIPVTVTEYKVTGVYVNNYLENISMNWATPSAIKNWGEAGTDTYNSVTDGGKYADALSGILYDESKATYFGNATHTNLTKLPNGADNTKVWAYNVLAAPKFGTGAFQNATTAAPRIIIQVKDLKASNGADFTDFRYITIGKLYEMDGTTEIKFFEAGKIYKIAAGDLEFSVKNVYEKGETGKIDLRVEVEVMGWTTQGMKPGLN